MEPTPDRRDDREHRTSPQPATRYPRPLQSARCRTPERHRASRNVDRTRRKRRRERRIPDRSHPARIRIGPNGRAARGARDPVERERRQLTGRGILSPFLSLSDI